MYECPNGWRSYCENDDGKSSKMGLAENARPIGFATQVYGFFRGNGGPPGPPGSMEGSRRIGDQFRR